LFYPIANLNCSFIDLITNSFIIKAWNVKSV